MSGLPAGFGHAGDHALGGHFTEGETGHLETTDIGATTTGDAATVREAGRAGVTGKQGQTDVVSSGLQFGAELRIFGDGFKFALFALKPAGFCHRGAESASETFFSKGKFSLAGRPPARYLPAAMFTGMVLAFSLLFLGVIVFTYLVKG